MASDFVDQTKATFEACGRWLMDNSKELAERVNNGCKDWSVTFSAGEDGLFPHVHVTSTNVDIPAITATYETAEQFGYDLSEVERVYTRHCSYDYSVVTEGKDRGL